MKHRYLMTKICRNSKNNAYICTQATMMNCVFHSLIFSLVYKVTTTRFERIVWFLFFFKKSFMKKAEWILIALFAIIFFRWTIYISNIEKSFISKRNGEITHTTDTVYIDRWNLGLISYADSIGKLKCTDTLVVDFLSKIDIENKHIVYAQMRLESGNYNSVLCKTNNNYFGMKQPQCRATLSIGEANGYAVYKSWTYSILDYWMWQKRYANGLTEEEYYDKLKSYAVDIEYAKKLKQISKSFKYE